MQRIMVFTAVCLLAACDSGSINSTTTPSPAPDPAPQPVAEASYEITATNLTVGQPLSPLAMLIHDSDQAVFTIGMPAAPGLELLAEGGDNSQLLQEIDSVAELSGQSPLGPGASETLSLSLPDDQVAGLSLSVVSMLVNTNDAVTGINALDLSELAVGETIELMSNAYDAGTEANTEAVGTIPGPADGGEGFNAARNDVGDFVTMHPGVVTAEDGLAGSVLNQTHRFDNPVARFTVIRTQ